MRGSSSGEVVETLTPDLMTEGLTPAAARSGREKITKCFESLFQMFDF
jgi:hypothetical protein